MMVFSAALPHVSREPTRVGKLSRLIESDSNRFCPFLFLFRTLFAHELPKKKSQDVGIAGWYLCGPHRYCYYAIC